MNLVVDLLKGKYESCVLCTFAKCENANLFPDILENLCQAHSFVLLFANASYCENGPLDGTFTTKMARSTSFVLFFTT